MMSHDDLDNLIRAALDAEPTTEQLARLEHFWWRQSRAETWRRRAWRVAAVAATIAVVAAFSLWQYQQSHSHKARPIANARGVVPTAPETSIVHAEASSGAANDTGPIEPRTGDEAPSSGRAPTAYERVIFTVQRRNSAVARSPATAAAVDRLIEQAAQGPHVDAEQLVATSELNADDLEVALLRRLLRLPADRKLAVLRLLEVCGTTRATPALLRLSRSDAFRDAALETIERTVGIEKLPEMVAHSSDARVRAALARRLLTADSYGGLRGYLSLVQNNDTRALALSVADRLAEPPVTKLLACLDENDAAVRLSAAIVLGHLNGPEITKSLVERVVQDPAAATEAWIALLACRGEFAEEFLSYATRQPQLLAHVNSARARWARMVN
jgi:hypothetical protein